MRDKLFKTFPNAKPAYLKEGGDFPFLTCPQEVSMHLQVHLRAQGLFPDSNLHTNTSDTNAGNDADEKTEMVTCC